MTIIAEPLPADIAPPPAQSRQAQSRPAHSGVGDTPLLRINTMPGRRFGSTQLAVVLRALTAAERELEALRERACAELFELAGTATGAERNRILQLKRAIYNRRDPADKLARGDWPAATAGWLEAQQRRLVARLAIGSGYARFLVEERAVLAEVAGHERFQLALALGSPQVLDAIRRYRGRVASPTAQDRKSERGIIQHVTRAMVRTSPLSQFTAVALASWSEDGAELDAVGFDHQHARAVLMIDRPLFCGAVTGMLAAGEQLSGLVERNRSIRLVDSQVRFMRYKNGQVHLLSAPLTRPLHTLLTLTEMGPLPPRRLAVLLADRLQITPEDGYQMVRTAWQAHLLRPGPVIDEQLENPLPTARAALADTHPAAYDIVSGIEQRLTEMSAATVPARRTALEQLRAAEIKMNELTARPARLHVNEDLMLAPVTVTDRGYRQALTDLADVTEYLSMFDWHHEMRALLATAVADRFGAGADIRLLDHAESLAQMVYRREAALDDPAADGAADDFGPADGSLQKLMSVRAQALEQLTSVLAASSGPEVRVDAGWLAGLTDGLPDRFRADPASHALLVQPADGRLVLGECYPGRGMLGMRFLGADRGLGGQAAQRIGHRIEQLLGTGGTAVREDHGLYNSNINHRIPLLASQITPEQWAGIRLVHDPDLETVRLVDAEGVSVRVLSLGMKWAELLPEPLRIAMWLADSDRIITDPLTWLRAAQRGIPATTERYPRLMAGQVVVQRRRWYPGADFTAALDEAAGAAQDREAEQLMSLTRWRADHDVPEEVMIKSPLMGTLNHGDQDETRGYVAGRRRAKPQYVDLASALMVRVLPRLLRRRGESYLEEALPCVRRGVRALEWVVEFDRAAGERFQVRQA